MDKEKHLPLHLQNNDNKGVEAIDKYHLYHNVHQSLESIK